MAILAWGVLGTLIGAAFGCGRYGYLYIELLNLVFELEWLVRRRADGERFYIYPRLADVNPKFVWWQVAIGSVLGTVAGAAAGLIAAL